MTQHDEGYSVIEIALGKRVGDVTGLHDTFMSEFVVRDFVAPALVPDTTIDNRIRKTSANEFFRKKYGESHVVAEQTETRNPDSIWFRIVAFNTFLVIEVAPYSRHTSFVVLHPPPEKISELNALEGLAAEICITTYCHVVLSKPEYGPEVCKEMSLFLQALKLLPAPEPVERQAAPNLCVRGSSVNWLKRLFGISGS